MLVKSVGVQSPDATVRAYDVAEIYRWVPAQESTPSLDRCSKLRGVLDMLKLLVEARNRQPESFLLLLLYEQRTLFSLDSPNKSDRLSYNQFNKALMPIQDNLGATQVKTSAITNI